MKTRSPSLCAALLLVTLAINSHITYAASNLTPVAITFSETRHDELQSAKNLESGDTMRYVDTKYFTHFVIQIPISGTNILASGSASVACEVGGFFHSAFLSEDPHFKPGKSTSVTYPLYDGVTFDTLGDPIRKGSITYSWRGGKKLTISMAGTSVASIVEDRQYIDGSLPSYTVVSSTTIVTSTESSGGGVLTSGSTAVTGTSTVLTSSTTSGTNGAVVSGTTIVSSTTSVAGLSFGPLGRWQFHNAVPWLVLQSGSAGQSEVQGNVFYGGVVSNIVLFINLTGGSIPSSGVFTLTSYALASKQPAAPPFVESVSPSGGGLAIILADQYPEQVTIQSVSVIPSGSSVPAPQAFSTGAFQFPLAPLSYPAGELQVETTGPVSQLNTGDTVVLTITNQLGLLFNTRFVQP
jgi:hypothetical protein